MYRSAREIRRGSQRALRPPVGRCRRLRASQSWDGRSEREAADSVSDSGPQPDSQAFDAGEPRVYQSILLAPIGASDEAGGCGADGLERPGRREVVGTIVEPHNQARSRSAEDGLSTIAVLGELEGRRFQVYARATQHCDKFSDEVGGDSTRPQESHSGEQGRPAVLPARR